MRLVCLLAVASALACNGPAATDDTDTLDTDATRDTDGGQDDTDVAGDTDDGGVPNAKADGVWSLASAGSTCNLNFAGDWDGVSVAENPLAFTLTQQGEGGQSLSCLFDAVTPTQFTCANKSFGGTIPPTCTISVAVTGVSGSVSGAAASMSVTLQVTSPNCAQALDCGPSAHAVSGTIAP